VGSPVEVILHPEQPASESAKPAASRSYPARRRAKS